MFDHFTFDTPSKTRTAGCDEDEQVCPKTVSSPAALSQSQLRRQPLEPCPVVDMILDDTIGRESEPQSDRETNPGIVNITHRLSNSHLWVGGCHHPPPLSRESTSTCSSASSPKFELDDRYQKPLLFNKSPHGTSSTGTPVVASPFPSPLEDDPIRLPPHPRPDVKLLRRQRSSKFDDGPQNACTIQTLVEGMVSTGTQCNAYTPPPELDTPIPAVGANRMDYELELTCLEVDENPGDDADYESPFIEKFLSLRRTSGNTGIRKSGFPSHPSSTDTALRCQHLVVRNKPRMRKRSKLRRQSSLAKLSAGDVPLVGSYSAAS